MLVRHVQRNLVWVDAVNPTPAEVKGLMQEFAIDPLIAEELLVPSFKPKIERRGDVVYLVLHFPSPRLSGSRAEQEIDFVIGRNFLITAHYEVLDPLHSFAKVFEVSVVLGRVQATHGGHLFATMARGLYQALVAECDALARRLEAIEERIFIGDERQMVVELSHAGRTIHDFRQALVPHREILTSLEAALARLFDQAFSWWMRDVIGACERGETTLEHLRDSLTELRVTNDSLLSTKQNEAIKFLTVMAFVTFPLTLVVDIFSLPTRYVPIIGMPGDFWIIIGILAVLSVAFFAFFKYVDWL